MQDSEIVAGIAGWCDRHPWALVVLVTVFVAYRMERRRESRR